MCLRASAGHEGCWNEIVGTEKYGPLADASLCLFVFRLQLYGLDRARSPGCADRGNAESFARTKGSDGCATNTRWCRLADLIRPIGRSCPSEERWDNGAACGYHWAGARLDFWTT